MTNIRNTLVVACLMAAAPAFAQSNLYDACMRAAGVDSARVMACRDAESRRQAQQEQRDRAARERQEAANQRAANNANAAAARANTVRWCSYTLNRQTNIFEMQSNGASCASVPPKDFADALRNFAAVQCLQEWGPNGQSRRCITPEEAQRARAAQAQPQGGGSEIRITKH